MHFRFAIELSDIDLWNVDLLDTHLDLSSPDKYTDIPSKCFVCLRNIFKTCWRHVFKTSLRHVLKMSSRQVFKTTSRHVFTTSSIRLQRNDFSSSATSWRRFEDVLQDGLKTSSRRLQDVLEDVKLLRWRRVEDVFKTNKCLLGISFRYCTVPR